MFRMHTFEMTDSSVHRMKQVLFLCTGNSARSQIGEALLKLLGGKDFEVFSAGTKVAPEVNPFALQVLAERGASIEGLYPKSVNQFTEDAFDLVITVCDRARQTCPFFPNAREMLHWSIVDPATFQGTHDEILAGFREIRNEIEHRIKTELLGS